MRLTSITIQKYRNFVDPQTIAIEDDVTCLVGKNESGKTTALKALHRLNPANGSDLKFNVTTGYPRWRLARDRRSEDLQVIAPVSAIFALSPEDLSTLSELLDVPVPAETKVHASRRYNKLRLRALPLPSRSHYPRCRG